MFYRTVIDATYSGLVFRNNDHKQKPRSITKLYRALASGVIIDNEVITVSVLHFLFSFLLVELLMFIKITNVVASG